MEAHRSRLLTTARPYLQVFSIFGLTPPPVFFTRTLHIRRRGYFIAGNSCYLLAILSVVIYECYANIIALQRDIHQFHAEDFSKVMGRTQKFLMVAMATCNQINMLLNFRRLRRIYEEIADLEHEMDKVFIGSIKQRPWWSFRFRLGLSVGLWIVTLVGFMPHVTLGRQGTRFHWTNEILTEIILIMQQLKGPEFCLFVLLVYELILRGRHILEEIHSELEDCNCRNRIQELCVTLKRNQLLVGRIWSLVEEIGKYFNVSMMLLFLYNGLTILHIVNWAITKSINPNDSHQYRRLGAALLLSINLLLACLYSEYCIRAYNSITRILHQIGYLPVAEEFSILKMGRREYSLQMQHLKLLFTCGGFFDINLKYFGGMVVTILGYIIIVVQFKIQFLAQLKYNRNNSEIID
ncbi:putative gustatory receptor 98d [Drosophila takahashii]|uniref:putative gustatory receptor 98d n=1 Tax=Drosophila takahashii TaxID=29030 RepID=UPI001CF8EE99|nr:putative gustatory receptor 98d [Drosophila takahashii]